jgi:hypothetical protein
LRTSASHGGDLPRPHEHEAEPHNPQITADEPLEHDGTAHPLDPDL